MKPIDYIYKNLDSFNISIFKQIVEESGEEVSESIYDYLMETTWNTNPALLKQFGLDIERSSEDESGEDTPSVIVLFDDNITFEFMQDYPGLIGYDNSYYGEMPFDYQSIMITIDDEQPILILQTEQDESVIFGEVEFVDRRFVIKNNYPAYIKFMNYGEDKYLTIGFDPDLYESDSTHHVILSVEDI